MRKRAGVGQTDRHDNGAVPVTVWALHSRHFKVGITQQLILPVTALLVICCTFLGDWAVLAAGLVSAAAVVTGVTLTARMAARERRSGTPEPAA
ncbi:hypothetical protein Scel_53530 [Streptomyces cellostaticus]|nr:hypothetical protein Scel_53530 [Streptomyces cellostaticus]